MLREHLKSHPAAQIEDVYKLLYQGTLGIEHLLSDTGAAKAYLDNEWERISSGKDEPLWEFISPDSQWVRLNLKSYKAAGGNTTALWQAMLRSSQAHGDKEIFLRHWQEFMSMVNEGRFRFDRQRLKEFDDGLAVVSYPVVHHSRSYLETYHPAYRMLRLAEAHKLTAKLSGKIPF
jgi:hypothetical protein